MNRPLVRAFTAGLVGILGLSACSAGRVIVPSSTAVPSSALQLSCPSGRLIGAGATSQKLAIDTLVSEYLVHCGGRAAIEYSGTGSGQGIKDFYNAQIDWAGSDSPLKNRANKDNVVETERAAARCAGHPAVHLPLVVSPVAFAHNLEGINDLVLTPELIADISFGRITRWNDPRIVATNPGVDLPDLGISVFFRSDDSGTTESVSEYLHAAAPNNFTAAPSKKWPGPTGEGRKGSQGVAEGVSSTRGGFGYMEWKFAVDNGLGVAKLDNGAGPVALDEDSAITGMETAKTLGSGADIQLGLDYAGARPGAYPALMVTYEIVCSTGLEADRTAVLKDFLGYAMSEDAQEILADEGHTPLPESLRTRVIESIAAIR